MTYSVTMTQNVWVEAKDRTEALSKAYKLFEKNGEEVKESINVEEI